MTWRLAWAAALALAACTVGPDFHPPDPGAPGNWGPERTDVRSRTTTDEADPRWWTQFRDPELSSLVGRVAAQNLDLQTAAERVQREVVASQGLPSQRALLLRPHPDQPDRQPGRHRRCQARRAA